MSNPSDSLREQIDSIVRNLVAGAMEFQNPRSVTPFGSSIAIGPKTASEQIEALIKAHSLQERIEENWQWMKESELIGVGYAVIKESKVEDRIKQLEATREAGDAR